MPVGTQPRFCTPWCHTELLGGDGFGHTEPSGAAKSHTKTRSIREVLDGVVLPGVAGCRCLILLGLTEVTALAAGTGQCFSV